MKREMEMEWEENDIRVNEIQKGWFKKRIKEEKLKGKDEGYIKGRKKMRRIGDKKEIEGVVMMMEQDERRYMNGQIIKVDGGKKI